MTGWLLSILVHFDENSILINRKGRSSDVVSGERPSVQVAGQMACPPITPAMALATAMITFRSVLQMDDLLHIPEHTRSLSSSL